MDLRVNEHLLHERAEHLTTRANVLEHELYASQAIVEDLSHRLREATINDVPQAAASAVNDALVDFFVYKRTKFKKLIDADAKEKKTRLPRMVVNGNSYRRVDENEPALQTVGPHRVTSTMLKDIAYDRWLYDDSINTWLFMVTALSNEVHSKPSRLLCLDSTSWATDCQRAGPVLHKKRNWMAYDYVLLPTNINRAHWALAVVAVNENKVFVYDSWPWDSKELKKVLNRIDTTIKLHKKKAPRTEFGSVARQDDWPVSFVALRQKNNFDCGVYLAAVAERYAMSSPVDVHTLTDNLCASYRGYMIKSLLNGKID
ncbi:hypothetical protein SDRG_15043 [Saprolegnia diclina VS20]|uniref:Ubiquitin-like protease family profile domain-containing protein n=1 Tax=Saprolegnia diclina (strain VS20) TaxID=1156394 RepID=T0RC27_SAPDV|nr:hypothetical protein SDRG_15043 [Saprolegnia diclina VS20]EQC27142.1 hypothetical protein SDRG_15043 [Saprolegnia diclina VS20]|eukprot:XP_008619428.1 hypothetical protein SDRG_15043 [Saprolegnia diclina VS20]